MFYRLVFTLDQSDHGCSEEERPQLIRVPDKVFYRLVFTLDQSDHGCSEEERPQLIRVPDRVFYRLVFYVCGRHTWTSLLDHVCGDKERLRFRVPGMAFYRLVFYVRTV